MTLINLALLLILNAFLIMAKDFAYPVVNWAYPMSKEAFNIINLSQVLAFKVLWGVFNLVPFLALLLISAE